MKRQNAREARNRRRAEATARQAERDARTPDEQIALIQSRPGNSARELARLAKGNNR